MEVADIKNNMIFVTKTKLPPIKRYYKYLEKIWANNWVTNNGELLRELEEKLRSYLGVRHMSLITNATVALQMAMKAIDGDSGGEVITTPFTFAASTNVILWEHMTPVFADIDPETFNIDPADIEKKITKKTRAILAVHVYGNPCDLEKIHKIATKHNLKVIYDAAHAFDVSYKGKSVLNYGDISILSFHATKVFNTIEGGALITKSKQLSDRLKLMRNFGIVHEEKVTYPGINGKMNEFQAAMGLCNLQTVSRDIKAREKMYKLYLSLLGNISGLRFQKIIASKYNFSYMPVLFRNKKHRDLVYGKLKENEIHARKYFYPLTSSFDYLSSRQIEENKQMLPVASGIADRVLCLPLYAEMTDDVVEKVVKVIEKYS